MDLNLARKWNSLGVPVTGMRMNGSMGNLKLVEKIEDIDRNVLRSKRARDYNCLAIHITGSNMVCLDIDNIGDSIERFNEYLVSNGLDLSDFLYEKTMNGGLHLYFINEGVSRNRYAMRFQGIRFDLLSHGRVFTSPTQMGERCYQFGKKSPMELKSLSQIGKAPAAINALIQGAESVKKSPRPVFL